MFSPLCRYYCQFSADKANMEGWYLLGRLRMLRSDPKDALEAFDNAVQCNPRCAPLWNSIGICHFQLHQLAEAEDALSTARALDPENILIWHNITLLVFLHLHFFTVISNSFVSTRLSVLCTVTTAISTGACLNCLVMTHRVPTSSCVLKVDPDSHTLKPC